MLRSDVGGRGWGSLVETMHEAKAVEGWEPGRIVWLGAVGATGCSSETMVSR